MASNPMQKKARNSFLLGMIITLVICALIGVLLYVLMAKQDQKKEEEEGALTYAYRLKTNIPAAQEITSADVEEVIVTEKAVPAGAFASRTKTTDSRGKETWVPTAFPGEYKAKVDLNAGTILASSLVYEGEELTHDVRYVEYNMLTLDTTVDIGSFIDVRLTLPSGLDLIVISKKEVKSIIGNTIGLELSEGEILMMESAIVEAYIMSASKLYATQYIEPGIQDAALNTYVPTSEVQNLIKASNNNIQEKAKSDLAARFDTNLRDNINSSKSQYSMEEIENVEAGLKEEIENAKAAREAYLSGLTSY